MSTPLRVHIVPIGFEYRRVTEPLIHMRADKVYLVKYKNGDEAANFYGQIERELGQKYKHVQTEDVLLNIWDLYECIGKFREIMLQERENHVYVNVSTGTKITAIAGMLSCMLWNAKPYYAPVSYAGRKRTVEISEHVSDPVPFPAYSIHKPKPESMLILDLLRRHGGTMEKRRIIKELEGAGIIKKAMDGEDELSASAKHSKLRSLLDPMIRDWGLVSVHGSGRKSEVSIEEQGETALKIFGTGGADTARMRPIKTERAWAQDLAQ